MARALNTLKSHSQRVGFASGRVQMLQGVQHFFCPGQALLELNCPALPHHFGMEYSRLYVFTFTAQFARRDALIRLQMKEEEAEVPTRDTDADNRSKDR